MTAFSVKLCKTHLHTHTHTQKKMERMTFFKTVFFEKKVSLYFYKSLFRISSSILGFCHLLQWITGLHRLLEE